MIFPSVRLNDTGYYFGIEQMPGRINSIRKHVFFLRVVDNPLSDWRTGSNIDTATIPMTTPASLLHDYSISIVIIVMGTAFTIVLVVVVLIIIIIVLNR